MISGYTTTTPVFTGDRLGKSVHVFPCHLTRKRLWIKVSVKINDTLYFGLVCTRHLAIIQMQGAWPFAFIWPKSGSHFPDSQKVFIQTESYSSNMPWPGKILHLLKCGHFLLYEVMDSRDFPGLK